MSLPDGAANRVGPHVNPCGAHSSDYQPHEGQVLPVQRLNVTFPDLPASVKPPFNVTHVYNIPDVTICSVGRLAGSPTWINDSWLEWDVHPLNWTNSSHTRNGSDELGMVGDAFSFSIWQAEDTGQPFLFWMSANYTVVDKLDGAGSMTRGDITPVQFMPSLLLAATLLFGLIL